MNLESVVLSAYREAVLAAAEKGYKGLVASKAATRVAAKVASRVLGREVTEAEAAAIIGNE